MEQSLAALDIFSRLGIGWDAAKVIHGFLNPL